jgi:hypothetical protein
MWTKKFWKAAAERMVRAGAASTLSFWVVGDGIFNAAHADWSNAGGSSPAARWSRCCCPWPGPPRATPARR